MDELKLLSPGSFSAPPTVGTPSGEPGAPVLPLIGYLSGAFFFFSFLFAARLSLFFFFFFPSRSCCMREDCSPAARPPARPGCETSCPALSPACAFIVQPKDERPKGRKLKKSPTCAGSVHGLGKGIQRRWERRV